MLTDLLSSRKKFSDYWDVLIPYVLFILGCFFVFGGATAALLAVTVICCVAMPKRRFVFLTIASIITVVGEFGIFHFLLRTVKLENGDWLLRGFYIAVAYLLVLVTAWLSQKYWRRYVILTLLGVQAIGLFALSLEVLGPIAHAVLQIYLILFAVSFFAMIFNQELKRMSALELGSSVLPIWAVATKFPIPFRLVKVHSQETVLGTNEQTRLYWRGVKLLYVNAAAVALFNGLLLFLKSEPLTFEKLNFNFVYYSAYEGFDAIRASFGGAFGQWAGFLFVGIGALLRVSVGLNFAVAIAVFCGFNLPANTSSLAYRYKTYGEFLRGFYFYYSYLLTRIFFPRVKKAFAFMTRGLSSRASSFVNVFLVIVITGFIFNFSRYAYPHYYNRGFERTMELMLGSLLYFIPAGALVAYSHLKLKEWEKFGPLGLLFTKIWIPLTYSILITIKTSQLVPEWDVSKIIQMLKELIR